MKHIVLFVLLFFIAIQLVRADEESPAWTFVSIPDFLNFDIEYPQEGCEDALGFVLDSMKKEAPAFVMVAGDLVMGHWGTSKKEIDEWAKKYYPPWVGRFKDHGLKVYTALGDHEVGDNPWRGKKATAEGCCEISLPCLLCGGPCLQQGRTIAPRESVSQIVR